MSGDYSLIVSDLRRFFDSASESQDEQDYWKYFGMFVDYVMADPLSVDPAYHLLCTNLFSKNDNESMLSLEIMNSLMNRPCLRIHICVDKFKFLNNFLRLLSKQYLGTSTSGVLRKRIVEVLYSWTLLHPRLAKVREAYQELKRKKVILQDPDHLFTTRESKMGLTLCDDFDLSPSDSKKFKKMLKSRKRSDHAAANSFIRKMFNQHESQMRTQATQERLIAEFNIQTKLLSSLIDKFDTRGEKMSADLINLEDSDKESLLSNLQDLSLESAPNGDFSLPEIDDLILGERVHHTNLDDKLTLGVFSIKNEGLGDRMFLGVITNMCQNDVVDIRVTTDPFLHDYLRIVKSSHGILRAFSHVRASTPHSFVISLGKATDGQNVEAENCFISFLIGGAEHNIATDLFTPLYSYLN